jgi:hypothetical protein
LIPDVVVEEGAAMIAAARPGAGVSVGAEMAPVGPAAWAVAGAAEVAAAGLMEGASSPSLSLSMMRSGTESYH